MATDDLFRARLDQMIDLRHPLAVLAVRMPWAEIQSSLSPLFAHRNRPGRKVVDADLFGTTVSAVIQYSPPVVIESSPPITA